MYTELVWPSMLVSQSTGRLNAKQSICDINQFCCTANAIQQKKQSKTEQEQMQKQKNSECKTSEISTSSNLFYLPPPPLLPTSFSIQWVHSAPKPATSLVLEVKGVTSSATLLARYLPLNLTKKKTRKHPF